MATIAVAIVVDLDGCVEHADQIAAR